jgi:undecaprenyl-diphosphatase
MTTLGAQPKTDAARGEVTDQSRTARSYLAWLVIALVSLAGLVILTVAVASKVVFPIDQSLLAWALNWAGWKLLWQVISETANIPLIVIGLGFVLWLFFVKKRRREALLVLLMLAAVTAGSELVKQLVARDRPSGGGAGIPGVVYSYPSGHELEVVSILGIVTMRIWRTSREALIRLGVVALVAIEALLVAVARMALNTHYPTDILAGLLGGIGALGLYAWWTRPGAWADKPPADSNEAGGAHERT